MHNKSNGEYINHDKNKIVQKTNKYVSESLVKANREHPEFY